MSAHLGWGWNRVKARDVTENTEADTGCEVSFWGDKIF